MQISEGIKDKKQNENGPEHKVPPHSAEFPPSSKNLHLSQELVKNFKMHHDQKIGAESLPSLNNMLGGYSPANLPKIGDLGYKANEM